MREVDLCYLKLFNIQFACYSNFILHVIQISCCMLFKFHVACYSDFMVHVIEIFSCPVLASKDTNAQGSPALLNRIIKFM